MPSPKKLRDLNSTEVKIIILPGADLLNSSSDVFRDVHEAGALFRIQVGEKLGQDAPVHLHQAVQVNRDEVAGSGNRVDVSDAAEKAPSFSHILSQTQSRTLSLYIYLYLSLSLSLFLSLSLSDFLFHRFLSLSQSTLSLYTCTGTW